jgi:hypothetical protein
MCIIACKKFSDVGWIGVKNRDRNYIPTVRIIQSNRNGIQRLYIDDEDTRYTEGLNEFGVCILSASLSVKDDEKEILKDIKKSNKPRHEIIDNYMSPDGKKIRDALYRKTPLAALNYLIETELTGCTIIFNKNQCFLLEGGRRIEVTKSGNVKKGEFNYKFKEIDENDIVVRTNHGILLPQYGYPKNSDDPVKIRSRKSSEVRYEISLRELKKITDPTKMLDALSIRNEKNNDDIAYMNPIRTGNIKKKEMVTTGQIMLTPIEKTMHYRPIHSDVEFSYTNINSPNNKTFFEVISNRHLLGFKEFLLKK